MAYDIMALDAKDLETLDESIKAYGEGAEGIINGVLHDFGGNRIKGEIHKLLPVSGRRWKKKKKAAKSTDPFNTIGGNLSVTISTKSGYGYLYFPDDGTNTRKHAGNQQFMRRGAERATDSIIGRCLAELAN
jgi:hypothetical protein